MYQTADTFFSRSRRRAKRCLFLLLTNPIYIGLVLNNMQSALFNSAFNDEGIYSFYVVQLFVLTTSPLLKLEEKHDLYISLSILTPRQSERCEIICEYK